MSPRPRSMRRKQGGSREARERLRMLASRYVAAAVSREEKPSIFTQWQAFKMAVTVFNVTIISRTLWFQLDHGLRDGIRAYAFHFTWDRNDLTSVVRGVPGKRYRPINSFFAAPGFFLLSSAVLRLIETVEEKTEQEEEMAEKAAFLFDEGGDEEFEPQDDDNEIVQLQRPRAHRA